MIADRYTEERIRSWLLAIAPESTPDRVLQDTFDQTRHMAQASRSRSRRALTLMPRRAAVATAVAVVLVAVGVGFGRIVPTEERAGPRVAALTSTIGGAWLLDENIAVTIERDPADTQSFYWRAAAYDRIDVHSLGSSGTETVVREPAARVFEGMADDVDRAGLRPFSFTVTPGSFKGPTILSPATPLSVDRRIRVTTVGPEGYFATLDVLGGGAYSVTALVDDPTSPARLTDDRLRAAGTDYPAEIVALYTTELPGVFGPNLDGLKTEIRRTSSSTAPFDLAQRLVTVLQDRPYTYDLDVRDIDCGTMSTAECFVASKRGYCVHYAATMAVVLRSLGVPARVVEGFLPGERVGPTEVIRNEGAHAWVEVYFPGFEWVTFDPSGGTLRAAG